MSVNESVSDATDQQGAQRQDNISPVTTIAAPADIEIPPPPPVKTDRINLDSPPPSRCPTPATPSSEKKMNGLSFSELCCLFCFPPCPGKIAAKLAFLPPEATYSLLPDETNTKFTLNLSDRAEWQYTQRELESVEVFYTRTSRGNRIGCM